MPVGPVRRVTFHLSRAALRDPAAELRPFYHTLLARLPDCGIAVQTVHHDRLQTLRTVNETPGFHIADHGALRHPRLLNTGVAYIYPYWNCDPWGIRALSSIAGLTFDPALVDMAKADALVAYLRRTWVVTRQSRGPQPEVFTEVPAGCIAVFLQSEHHRDVAETCHLTLREMVAAVLARDDPRPVVIKPHPRDRDPATARFLQRLTRDPRVRIVTANIHDILPEAAVCITINSAVGIEAMLHACPVVLCGRTDFHHCAMTVRDVSEMDAAIVRAQAQTWPFAAFLYWYFASNCLNAGSSSLASDLVARISAAGYAL